MRNIPLKDWHIIILLMLSVIALRIASLPAYPVPFPKVTDEFAYLYAAKTFASGHLSNPTHPLWHFFESQHILSYPTSISKYQPATALFMAASYHLTGEYYWGVVFGVALLIGSIYWALRGWTNRFASLTIALFFLLLLRTPDYWINSYWGGAVPMTACMLMLGSYPRIFYRQQYHFIWPGLIGLCLGLLSRPFETGLCALLLSCGGLCYMFWNMTRAGRITCFQYMWRPLVGVGALLLLWQGYYNYHITGSALQLPYQLYQNTYGVAPIFYGQAVHEEYWSSNPVVATWQNAEWQYYTKQAQFLPQLLLRTPNVLGEYLSVSRLQENTFPYDTLMEGLLLLHVLVPLLLGYVAFKFRRGYLLLLGCSSTAFAAGMMLPMLPHYLIAYLSFYMIGLLFLCQEWLQISAHAGALRLLFASLAVVMILTICLPGTQPSIHRDLAMKSSMALRETIRRGLEASGRKHIIFVNYKPAVAKQVVHGVWLYNEPDIDHANIIWAQDISPKDNQKLIDYYPNRQLWYIEPYYHQSLQSYESRNAH